jgi:hypothetical protein
MGLSSQGYNGHIFGILNFGCTQLFWPCNPIWQNHVLIIVLIVCRKQKKATVYGYKGAMYPWESDDTGEEATPTWALTGILSNILLQMFRSLSGTTMRIHKIKLVEKGMECFERNC